MSRVLQLVGGGWVGAHGATDALRVVTDPVHVGSTLALSYAGGAASVLLTSSLIRHSSMPIVRRIRRDQLLGAVVTAAAVFHFAEDVSGHMLKGAVAALTVTCSLFRCPAPVFLYMALVHTPLHYAREVAHFVAVGRHLRAVGQTLDPVCATVCAATYVLAVCAGALVGVRLAETWGAPETGSVHELSAAGIVGHVLFSAM